MKKIISLITALLLIFCSAAVAEGGIMTMNDELFVIAKEALPLFQVGDYEGAAALLGFGSGDEFKKFITGNFLTFAGDEPVQTTVSVAWWNKGVWLVAIPLYEPASPEVETLVLVTDSIDCTTYCGYIYAEWGDVEAAYSQSDYVIWNEEYIETESMIIYMDD